MRLSLYFETGRTSCLQTLSTPLSQLESLPLCSPGCRLSIVCVLRDSGRGKRPRRRAITRGRGHRLSMRHRLQPIRLDRLRYLLFLHGALRSNRAICSMPSPLGATRNQTLDVFQGLPWRTRLVRKKLSRPVRNNGQDAATEVRIGRGIHAIASAMKRSKRAREVGLVS